jgi:excisionase family DNA binding protein
MSVTIPTFIPLADAARKYNIPENMLTRLIQDGRIEAARLPSGELLVSDNGLNQKTKEQIIEEKFRHLQGIPITVTEAAEKYNIVRNTLLNWVKYGHITVLKPGYRMELNEAEVAYCAEVYRKRTCLGFSTRIFDENGLPYQLKHPDLAAHRRRKNQESK